MVYRKVRSFQRLAWRGSRRWHTNEGVRPLRGPHPAWVIAANVMPEQDGIETVNKIFAMDRAGVISRISGAGEGSLKVARMLGARSGFEKPVRVEELLGGTRLALHSSIRN